MSRTTTINSPVRQLMRQRRFMQNSWVVHDIDAAMALWTRTAGVGPFFVVKGITLEDQRYRGLPAGQSIEVTFALAQAGDLQIELVCQHNDVPSAYRDTVPAGRSAFHHMALYTHDYDKDRQDYLGAGCAEAFSGAFAGKRFCYIDTSASLGCMVELIEASAAQEEFFERIAGAAHEWDGTEPVRPAF